MNESKVAGSGRSLTSLIDAEPVSSYQTVIIALCAMIAMLDGFDTQAVAFVAPLLAVAFKASVGVFGSVFASGLLGGLLGALVFGLVADRFGRKATLIVTVGLFAVSSLLTIRAGSVLQLLVYRFVTGIGLGGAMPSIIALTAEYAPRRLRATLVTAMFCGFPLGAVIGAIASTRLLPIYGWQAVFLTGGVLPLLLLPLVILALPESIRWLAARNRQDAISRVLTRMRRRGSWNGRTTVEDEPAPRSSHVAGLFASGRGAGTLLLWATFFMSLLLVYLLVSWIPTMAEQTGRARGVGTLSAAALNLGGILGSLLFGRLIDRFGPFRVISLAYVVGAAVVAMLGFGTDLASSIYWFAALAGFFCVGAQLCVVAIASDYYSLELRATGVGWAMGVGRMGAIAGPLIGGWLIGQSDTHAALFALLAATSLGCGLTILAMGRVALRSPTPA